MKISHSMAQPWQAKLLRRAAARKFGASAAESTTAVRHWVLSGLVGIIELALSVTSGCVICVTAVEVK
jgi:hypothetical protein